MIDVMHARKYLITSSRKTVLILNETEIPGMQYTLQWDYVHKKHYIIPKSITDTPIRPQSPPHIKMDTGDIKSFSYRSIPSLMSKDLEKQGN